LHNYQSGERIMAQKTQQPDLKKHFEAILGREIVDLSEGEIIVLRELVGLYSTDQGEFSSREIGTTGFSTKACGQAGLFSIGGITITGVDGKAEFLLSDYHCHHNPGASEAIPPAPPVIFVATAQSDKPVFVTTRTFIANLDLRVEIYTWEPGGAPAGGQVVKWFCRFPIGSVIF
jgi:hypothetical protein